MRVTYVAEAMPHAGGAEAYLCRLAAAVGAAGHTTSLVMVHGHMSGHHDAITTFGRNSSTFGSVSNTTGRDLQLVVADHRPNIVHWNFSSPFAFDGGKPLVAWRVAAPTIATDHLPQLRGGPRWEITRQLANRRFRAVIVVGDSALAAARAHWRRYDRFVVIRNGVALGRTRVRSWNATSPLRLIVVGRLEYQKNPLFAVEVFDALRASGIPATLTFAGVGSVDDALRRRVAFSEYRASIQINGYVEDIESLMLASHVMISASRFEGLPLAVLEATCSGLPVVATDIEAHRELAALSPSIQLAIENSVESFVATLGKVANELASFSECALQNRDQFAIERGVLATLRLYQELST
jgi:glycosyltransferase involved in cell wall biosynthesis